MDHSIGDVTDIDRRTCSRVIPMRVIGAGLPRTGTLSLRKALKTLGYGDIYHMTSAIYENIRDCEMWLDAFRAKCDGVGTFEEEDWDKLLGHCEAVTGDPASFFIMDLVKAYPDAKVVLTTRDPETWYRSVTSTVAVEIQRYGENDKKKDPRTAARGKMLMRLWDETFKGEFETRGKEIFLEHTEKVRQSVPKENLLEWFAEEGWEPLCEFLGVPVPDEPYPHLNDPAAFADRQRIFGNRPQAPTNGVEKS